MIIFQVNFVNKSQSKSGISDETIHLHVQLCARGSDCSLYYAGACKKMWIG